MITKVNSKCCVSQCGNLAILQISGVETSYEYCYRHFLLWCKNFFNLKPLTDVPFKESKSQ